MSDSSPVSLPAIVSLAEELKVEILPEGMAGKESIFEHTNGFDQSRLLTLRSDGSDVTLYLPSVGYPRSSRSETQISWSSYSGPNGVARAEGLQRCLLVAVRLAKFADLDFAKHKERLTKEWTASIANMSKRAAECTVPAAVDKPSSDEPPSGATSEHSQAKRQRGGNKDQV